MGLKGTIRTRLDNTKQGMTYCIEYDFMLDVSSCLFFRFNNHHVAKPNKPINIRMSMVPNNGSGASAICCVPTSASTWAILIT